MFRIYHVAKIQIFFCICHHLLSNLYRAQGLSHNMAQKKSVCQNSHSDTQTTIITFPLYGIFVFWLIQQLPLRRVLQLQRGQQPFCQNDEYVLS